MKRHQSTVIANIVCHQCRSQVEYPDMYQWETGECPHGISYVFLCKSCYDKQVESYKQSITSSVARWLRNLYDSVNIDPFNFHMRLMNDMVNDIYGMSIRHTFKTSDIGAAFHRVIEGYCDLAMEAECALE